MQCPDLREPGGRRAEDARSDPEKASTLACARRAIPHAQARRSAVAPSCRGQGACSRLQLGLRNRRRRFRRQRLHELRGAVDDRLALTVDRDHVVAVLEHRHLDAPAEVALQEVRVVDAGDVVLARMQDQRRLRDRRPAASSRAATSRRCSNIAPPGVFSRPALALSPVLIAFMMKSRMRSSLMPCGARSEKAHQAGEPLGEQQAEQLGVAAGSTSPTATASASRAACPARRPGRRAASSRPRIGAGREAADEDRVAGLRAARRARRSQVWYQSSQVEAVRSASVPP